MKSLIVIMAVLVMAFGFSTVGFAGSDQQTGQMGYVCGVTGHSYTGRITSMNQAGDRIVVNGAEGDKGFVVSNATPNGGFQANEMVTVNYTERAWSMVASSVSNVSASSIVGRTRKPFQTGNGAAVEQNLLVRYPLCPNGRGGISIPIHKLIYYPRTGLPVFSETPPRT